MLVRNPLKQTALLKMRDTIAPQSAIANRQLSAVPTLIRQRN